MKLKHAIWFCLSMCAFVCAAVAGADPDAREDESYVVMDSDLAEIKADFNSAVDQVRLVFIVGPT